MNSGIGWKFPPTNGGLADGYNNSGIAHFGGAPLSSLARETIQNSLDAQMDPAKLVHVSFELIDLSPADIGGNELALAIDACKEVSGIDSTAKAALKVAQKSIQSNKIPCLRISDRNTTRTLKPL